ncbi:hypothetical protein [Micromonospora yangpuensis]|uniref:Uncharacterized protein n=1 Tax=Micromonospora yangpuensis TaxID=683228 RepID=A0A1C6U285_9ACTN|nr:hypothetical protein [Micromonospora yangpuensis]GGM10420.1 hypothetical protein GCM10012279_30600 [Micromonospora yangpuensis]SCL48124.1 hypothetical protein GA0070617_0783 [Micromonospora yangpuensis]
MSEPGEIEYCHSWNVRRNRVGVALSEDEARGRDAAGEQFIAALRPRGSRQPVLVTVSGQTDTISVTFRDQHGRQNLKYWFVKADDERLFLRTVMLWEYPNDDPKLRQSEATKVEELSFRPDGYVQRIVMDHVERMKDTYEYDDVPVADNWEPVPEFGDYWSIARRERGARPVSEPAAQPTR